MFTTLLQGDFLNQYMKMKQKADLTILAAEQVECLDMITDGEISMTISTTDTTHIAMDIITDIITIHTIVHTQYIRIKLLQRFLKTLHQE